MDVTATLSRMTSSFSSNMLACEFTCSPCVFCVESKIFSLDVTYRGVYDVTMLFNSLSVFFNFLLRFVHCLPLFAIFLTLRQFYVRVWLCTEHFIACSFSVFVLKFCAFFRPMSFQLFNAFTSHVCPFVHSIFSHSDDCYYFEHIQIKQCTLHTLHIHRS